MITTIDNRRILLEELNLEGLYNLLLQQNFSDLHDIIKLIDVDKYNFTFYKAQYKFTNNIIHDAKLNFLLEDDELISIDHELFPAHIARDIIGDPSANNEPLGLIIKNCTEQYLNKDETIKNEQVFYPGDFFGIPRTLDSKNRNRSSVLRYNLCAGSKSAFMLQSIKDSKIYKQIFKTTGFYVTCPTLHNTHWRTFADIAKLNQDPWMVEIIFFSRKFIDMINEMEFAKFYVYLNKLYVKNYTVKHNIFNLWQVLYFSRIEKNTIAAKYNHLYIQAIKEIFLVASKSNSGFQPSTSNLFGPFDNIKNVFVNHYGLKNPIIMEPGFFDYANADQKPIYLSFMFQYMMKDLAERLSGKTKITIVHEINQLFKLYLLEIENDSDLKNSELGEIMQNISIQYFHNSQDIMSNKNILPTMEVIMNDPRFDQGSENLENDLSLNTSSGFFVTGLILKRK